MLANGSDWSSLLRTASQGCGPMRGGWMLTFIMRDPWSSVLAIADGDGAARGLHGLVGERDVGDLLDWRLLVLLDVAVLDAVLDGPLGALRVEARIDRQHAVLGLDINRVFDRF